ncbi:type II toxin-antitoxin system HipA family toxin [Haloferula rosea]|uniref:Type II toxin-antitoxin system HipA family toxin n=1 Tax=Haloferula rosea TaxID=490093 RepID=A0A934RA55_9BACT|nr:type II toxin-antitoxin system HipA family toxin [Haloferula rosea]MBK1826018.1 type II toxin-antitoxin system HipA family toxin [Haloferula rosea]
MKLEVRYKALPDEPLIGQLADDARGRIYFQFDPDWPGRGIDLSPLFLPLDRREALSTPSPTFSPLFGLFDDSLPDWWGLRIMRRHFLEMNIPWNEVTPLEKLACQGRFALGALSYAPDLSAPSFRETLTTTVTELVGSARELAQGEPSELLPALVRGGLSPGGAQPKVLVAFNEDFSRLVAGGASPPEGFSRWMIKFQLDADQPIGREEQAITRMAATAGIRVPETRLYEMPQGAAHFMARRFDHDGQSPLHVHSFAGLTHTAVRELIDYRDLMNLTRELTRDEGEIEEMFRRAVFNIAIANDDDHSRNHAFMLTTSGDWKLSPAYDLTRSSYALGSGYRAAGIMGAFTQLGIRELRELGRDQSLRRIDHQIEQVLAALRRWPEFAQKAGIAEAHARTLAGEMPGLIW